MGAAFPRESQWKKKLICIEGKLYIERVYEQQSTVNLDTVILEYMYMYFFMPVESEEA